MQDKLRFAEEARLFWKEKIDTVQQQELDTKSKELEDKETELEQLINPPDISAEPKGPQWMRFLERDMYKLGASIIIITNIVIMFMELRNPQLQDSYFIIDQLFLIFYSVELVCSLVLYQWDFLCPLSNYRVVGWNWMDLIIVVFGILDQWVLPLMNVKESGGSSPFMALRLLRLVRIVKIMKNFFNSDLSWTESNRFQAFILCVIGFNSILIALESDIPGFSGWVYIENLLLLVFLFELAVRLKHDTCKKFFTDENDWGWNWMDFIIVVEAILDQWLMPIVMLVKETLGMNRGSSGSIAKVMMMLRMARLLRILRLGRLIRQFSDLFDLITGIAKALGQFKWLIILTMVFLYIVALLIVRTVGPDGIVYGSDAESYWNDTNNTNTTNATNNTNSTNNSGDTQAALLRHEIEESFGSVPQTIFVLFKAMNGDAGDLVPLFTYLPFTKYIMYMPFMVLSSWAMLSSFTAVVSDSMMNANQDNQNKRDKEIRAQELDDSKLWLDAIFTQMDKSKNDELDENEFKHCCEESAGEINAAAKMDRSDVLQLFDALASAKLLDVEDTKIPYSSHWEVDLSRCIEKMKVERAEARQDGSADDDATPNDIYVVSNQDEVVATIHRSTTQIDYVHGRPGEAAFPLKLKFKYHVIKRDDFIRSLQNEGAAVTERTVYRLEERLIVVEKVVKGLLVQCGKVQENLASYRSADLGSENANGPFAAGSPAGSAPHGAVPSYGTLVQPPPGVFAVAVWVGTSREDDFAGTPTRCTVRDIKTLEELSVRLCEKLQISKRVESLVFWDARFKEWSKPADLSELPGMVKIRMKLASAVPQSTPALAATLSMESSTTSLGLRVPAAAELQPSDSSRSSSPLQLKEVSLRPRVRAITVAMKRPP